MQLLVSEVFENIEKCKNVTERKEVLIKNDSPRLREFLGLMFNDVEWFISEENEIPEWYPAKEERGYTPSTILHELRRIYIWYKGTENVTYKRKHELLSQLLESVHPDESNIIIALMMKKLKVKGLTKKLVSDTFPNVIKKGEKEG